MARRRRPPRAGALTELPPMKIATQILLLQSLYYVSALVLILFSALVAGRHFTLDMMFDWHSLRGDNTAGYMLFMDWLLCSFLGVISLLLLITRSKLVPDFAITLHVIHLLITSFYSSSIPRNMLWWALQFASAGLMTSLGVWACRYRELRPINFGGSSSAAAPGELEGQGSANSEDAVEQGYGRGRGRGRGRDGAGSYEMVDMEGKEGGGD